MKKKSTENKQVPEPTKSELEILKVLWEYGPSTVRFVNDKLNEQTRPVQYTSTLKLMQIMFEKKMLERDDTKMKHVYKPVEEEEKTKSFMLSRFVDAMYNGSASRLVMQLLGNKKTSAKELKAIKELLSDMEEKKQGPK